MKVVAFPTTAERWRDPVEAATDAIRVAVADFAIALHDATTLERARAIRKQIAGRVLELEAMEMAAVDREIALERGQA